MPLHITPNVNVEMRWWHGALFVFIGVIWRWTNKHVKYFKAKLNGYTITKDNKQP